MYSSAQQVCVVLSFDFQFKFRGLKLLLEPILQGVLETDVNYMMDFDHFFEQVKSIGRMKVYDIICDL